MPVSRNILGMNARNFLFVNKYNSSDAKKIADDKLETKRVLAENGIATPNLIQAFYSRESLRSFDWSSLPVKGFVIKPARGYGGLGILPVRKFENGSAYINENLSYSIHQLESHVLDIFEGAYSLKFLPDIAFIEERIILHPFFKKYRDRGIPDIRIICFNAVPIMAMLRLPTTLSNGKANLHQGALGFGIDIRTGITTGAILYDQHVDFIPDTKIKTRGIRLPFWDDMLKLAAITQVATGLGYSGIDIALDRDRGPLILEVNARPGLSIQNANKTSLRSRLERVENMVVGNPERGVEIGKNLFTADFSEKINISPIVLSINQEVIIHAKGKQHKTKAKMDTGARRSSIDKTLLEELGIPLTGEFVHITSASGSGYRPTANVTIEIGGKKKTVVATVADRSHLTFPMLIGHKDMKGFLIKPIYDSEFEELMEE